MTDQTGTRVVRVRYNPAGRECEVNIPLSREEEQLLNKLGDKLVATSDWDFQLMLVAKEIPVSPDDME